MKRNVKNRLETNIVMTFEIVKFRQLKATEMHAYRGRVSLKVGYIIPGKAEPIEHVIDNIALSSLCCHTILTKKSDLVGVKFVSYNTSPDYRDNPFTLVKSGGKHYLYMVHENGHYFVDNVLPGGEVVKTIKFKYKKAVDYVRYLDADSLRRPQASERPVSGTNVFSRPVTPAEAFKIDNPNRDFKNIAVTEYTLILGVAAGKELCSYSNQYGFITHKLYTEKMNDYTFDVSKWEVINVGTEDNGMMYMRPYALSKILPVTKEGLENYIISQR